MIRAALIAAALAALPVQAQEAAEAPGAVLRGLDKVAGTTSDLELAAGQSVAYGHIVVTLRECRYPAEDPSSNAFAYLTITDRTQTQVVFDGWMIADSPALSALDHQRYDVWVIRCKID
ncbi:MAG: DUF2155 domain-containing protein [Rhodobacteraceae bacterium]|nr:DUF2155 domain-containing protein [Paracoccaceae bacterium]